MFCFERSKKRGNNYDLGYHAARGLRDFELAPIGHFNNLDAYQFLELVEKVLSSRTYLRYLLTFGITQPVAVCAMKFFVCVDVLYKKRCMYSSTYFPGSREDPGANEQNTVKEVLGESEFQPGIILESKIVNFVTSWRFFTPRCFLINLLLTHDIIPPRLNYSCSTLSAFYV